MGGPEQDARFRDACALCVVYCRNHIPDNEREGRLKVTTTMRTELGLRSRSLVVMRAVPFQRHNSCSPLGIVPHARVPSTDFFSQDGLAGSLLVGVVPLSLGAHPPSLSLSLLLSLALSLCLSLSLSLPSPRPFRKRMHALLQIP